MLTFVVLLGTTAFAQTTWYVNNQIGNDGRNGFSPTIPSPDDGITGPKKTIGGAQGAVAESNAGDIIVVAYTGVPYNAGTGEVAFTVDKRLTFKSTGGTAVNVGVLLTLNNANASPNNTLTFDSGEFIFSAGLTLQAGVLMNTSQLVTVSGTVTRAAAAATVSGQLKYTQPVDFSYGATMTTGDEFPASGGTLRHITTTAGNLTVKTGTSLTMTGVFTTAGNVNLGSGVFTITNAAAATHTLGGNVTNGTLAFSLGGGDVAVNGAFTIPTVSATTSTATARTLDINGPTQITGTLTVNQLASVTSSGNTLTTLGTAAFTGDVLTLSGTGTVNLGTSLATVNGNVLLNTALSTAGLAGGATITFAAATTVNGNVTNNATLTVTNAATWNGMTGGRIVFANAAHTITGNVVNSTSIGGATGATLDVDGFGLIVFNNVATNVTINGQLNNTSNTTLASSTNPTDFSGNGLITMVALTTGDVRVDGGINNSSNYAGMTGGANVNNGQIVIGGAGRTAGSQIGAAGNRVGLITNSSQSPLWNDGNGDIIIAGDDTQDGFFGTNVTISGSAVGGKTVFGNENFDITGNITNSRTNANATLQVGTAGTAGVTVTIGGNIVNQGTGTTSFAVSTTGAVAVTGAVQSTANGTITWPNLTSGPFTIGGLSVSSGTVTVPATHTVTITVNGNVSLTGGTVNLLSSGGVPTITMTGNTLSFTGGTLTTTGVTTLTLNSPNITFGGASTNTTFSTAGTAIVIGNPTPTSLITVTIGAFNPTIAGNFSVSTNNGLAQPVNFTGGTMTVTGSLTFATSGTSSLVNISNQANITVVGNFTNTTGYTTTEQGRVTVGGGAGQTFGGAGVFGNIEFKNAAGPATSSPVTLTGFIYLTSGAVNDAGGAISIDNSTTYPTIVRNAGSFVTAPTFVSMVNVSYIGDDKAAGNELPAAASKLNNLTVATTTGVSGIRNTPSRGAVTITTTTVNGTLTVNSGQALIIGNGQVLSIKGASVAVNGDIANIGTGVLSLERTSGTAITGNGYLPPIVVAAGSTGNTIDGPIAIVHQRFGTDGEIDPTGSLVDDFNPATTSANGALGFGAGSAGLSMKLTGVAFDGTDLGGITTADAANSLTLTSNIEMSGNFTHVAGTADLGGFTLTHLGTAPSFTGGALTTNGTLVFGDGTTTGATLFSLNTSDVTIASNVNVNLGAAATTFTLDPATAGNLIISGTFTVTKGDVVLGDGLNARNLTCTGSAVTLTANGTIDVTPTGIGTFRLNPTTPPMTFTYAGTPTIARLRVSNDVNLAGTGTALTVSTLFTHDGGVLNFGAKDLTFETAFTRTAGTYTATTGYMIFDANAAWTIDQGDGFSIPNLRFTATGLFNIALSNAAGRGNVTVTNALDFVLAAQSLTTNGKLVVNDGVTVNYTSGTTSAAPNYVGTIKLVGLNYANPTTIPANIWPANTSLVTSFTVNGAAAGDVLNLPGNRTVVSALNLTRGTLGLGANTLTLGTGAAITRTNLAAVTVGAGGFSFPADNSTNVTYYANTAGLNTGIELPATLNNLTISRNANGLNQVTTIASSVTVNGTLTIYNDFAIPAAPPTVNVIANGNITIADQSGTYALATNPTITNNQSLVLGGAANQTITVPDVTPPQNLGNIEIRKTSPTSIITLTGGNLRTGNITFVNGHLVTGDHIVYLPAPTTGAVAGGALSQGFDRTQVVGGNVSHIVGNVAKTLVNNGAINTSTEFRSEFPVGTIGQYRPAAITFNPAFGVPTNPNVTIVVKYKNENPGGAKALPIANGVANGIDVARYPGFYWNIYTVPGSVGPTTYFDLELNAGAFTDYDSPSNVRIIRRHGTVSDLNNDWLLQGTNDSYDNEVTAISGFSAINRGANAGLRAGGAIFTLGLKSNMSVANPIPAQALMLPDAPKEIDLANVFEGNIGTLAYTAQSSNPAVVTVAVSGTKLTLTQVALGNAQVTILAKDELNNDFFAYSFGVTVTPFVSVEELEVPTEYALYQNFPNPFNPTTNIKFALPSESNVTLKIYNVLGQEVMTLVNKVMNAGYHTVNFDASNLTSGMYIYRIEAENFVQVKKMLLMK